MSLFDSLSKISEQIQSQRHLITSEQATILVSIQPFIRALGYDTQNLAEVQPEYTADAHSSGTERVDYVIKRDGKPIILIEVKTADTVLNKHHWKQLHNYFVALDVEFGVLTNGIEYRFFTDLKKRNVMDEEPFLVIDMRKLDPSQMSALEGFSKSRYAPNQTIKKLKVSNLLDQELSNPSDEFVKHFARQVHQGPVFQSVIEDYRPMVKRAWDDLVDQEIARRLRRHEELEEDNDTAKAGEAEPVTSLPATEMSALSSGVETVQIPVYGIFRQKRFEAILHFSGAHPRKSKIESRGELLSPSKAAQKIKLSIDSTITGATNGWTFWILDTADSDAGREINDLRKDESLFHRLLSQS